MEHHIATLWSWSLAHDQSVSLQKKLHGNIRAGILSGTLKSGERLPATRALAKRLGIARNTVIEAYDQLIAEGYLTARIGAGTYISDYTPDKYLSAQDRPDTPAYMPDMHKADAQTPPLLSGMPALDKFPRDVWARVAGKAARTLTTGLMYHNDPLGYAPLRRNIAAYLSASRTVVCSYEQIMITSGLQQGLFLLASVALEMTDSVILEDPGFVGIHAAATASGRTVKYTGVDENGACVPQHTRGLLVVSPSQQYPLGHTMPHSRRQELLRWAHASNSLILEDDYDSEFRYAGRPLNSLQGIDGGERVVYGGTFSKSLFPALRMGYLVLPRHLVKKIQAFRAATDSFPAITGQLALNSFMESGEFTKHIRRLRKIHARRQSTMTALLHQHVAPYFTAQLSDAGLHLLLRPTRTLRQTDVIEEVWVQAANTAGIGAVALSHAYREVPPQTGVVMGYANIKDADIAVAIVAFRKIMQKETGY